MLLYSTREIRRTGDQSTFGCPGTHEAWKIGMPSAATAVGPAPASTTERVATLLPPLDTLLCEPPPGGGGSSPLFAHPAPEAVSAAMGTAKTKATAEAREKNSHALMRARLTQCLR